MVMCVQEPPAPAPGVEQEEEGPMYFQDPRTLLQIYAQLEEQNLFLIQNAQESEEALEELRAKFRYVPTASVCCSCAKTPDCVYMAVRSCPEHVHNSVQLELIEARGAAGAVVTEAHDISTDRCMHHRTTLLNKTAS